MDILFSLWNVLAKMAPWLMLGFFLAGVASVLLPREWVVKSMGRKKGFRGILNAVLIGVPLPVCSCGVLPLSAALRKSGSGKGAVSGFLISTPQTGIDSILATYALLGPAFAIIRPVAAFLTGLVGGAAVDFASEKEDNAAPQNQKPKCCCHCKGKEPVQEVKKENVLVRILRSAYVELLGDISKPLAIGLAVSAVVTAFVPDSLFSGPPGKNGLLAMPLMLIVGFPMYVCSTASIPIAASLMAKGLSPGAALVFLMVGPAINAASIAGVSKLIGLRETVVYALAIAIGAIICGMGLNLLPVAMIGDAALDIGKEGASCLGHISAAALVACIANAMIRGRMHKSGCGH